MAVFRDWDYNKQDIAKNSGLSPRHATLAIERLEKLEIIKKTRNVGLSQMYQYNTENKAATLLQQFLLELAGQEAEKTANEEIAKAAPHDSQDETTAEPIPN
jgi:tRNA(Ile2) C34 agmatinyltransferase TiaS